MTLQKKLRSRGWLCGQVNDLWVASPRAVLAAFQESPLCQCSPGHLTVHQHLTVHHFLTRETQRHYLPICLLLRLVRRRKHTNMRMMFLGTRQSLEVDVMKVGVDFEWEWQMCVIQLFSASIGYFGQCFLHPVQPPYYQRGFLWQLTVLITK